MGLLYLFTICWVVFFFVCLDWVCFTFRIDVGLFCGFTLLQFFFFFCLKSRKNIYIYIYIY